MIRYLLLFVAVSASLLSSSAAEPSSSARPWKYDVFLNFRGPDTRKSVTFELYDRLHRRGIKTFKDDPDLVGHPISPTLDATIEESRFAIVVLSPNYASSTWCLEELRKIFECMKDENRILPIFYHVDPSDVRHRRKKSFEEAFTKHENSGQHTSEKVQQWRDALENMASISGWHTQNFRNDRELVDAIVEADERELKRQRRKQSNRESARRSRLRKQAECDELAQRAEALKDENSTLRSEVSRIRSEYEQLLSENASLKERLGEVPGHEDLRPGRSDQHLSNDTNQIAQTEPHGGH